MSSASPSPNSPPPPSPSPSPSPPPSVPPLESPPPPPPPPSPSPPPSVPPLESPPPNRLNFTPPLNSPQRNSPPPQPPNVSSPLPNSPPPQPPSASSSPPNSPPPPVTPPHSSPMTSISPTPSNPPPSSLPMPPRPNPPPTTSPPLPSPSLPPNPLTTTSPPLPSPSPPPNSPPTSPPPFPPPNTSPTPPPPLPSPNPPPTSPPPLPPPSPLPNPPTTSPPPSPPPNTPPTSPPPSPSPPVESPPQSRPPTTSPPPRSPPSSPPSSPVSPPNIPPTRSTRPPETPPPTPSTIRPPPQDPPSPSPPQPQDPTTPPSFPSPPPPDPKVPLPPPNQPQPNNPRSNPPQPSPGTGGRGIGTGVAVAIVVAAILFLGICGIGAFFVKKRKKKDYKHNVAGYIMPTSITSTPKSDSGLLKLHMAGYNIQNGSGSVTTQSPNEPGGLGNSRSWFTYEELVAATNGFSNQNLLGKGGFGSVYKGTLPDGRAVAVKQLNIDGGQGEREFKSEVEIISRIHHRHLVSLVGYCIADERRLLVYDYLPNNTLYFHLHGLGRPVMDWATRVKIAVGAARGIAYLHEDCNPRIIHRDIKSSNILLDYNFDARVSDFGLAKLAMDANSHITTRVMGTFGYMAPEYASSGKLTDKSDVYSFGVVLLELITGRKPVDTSQPLGEESIVEWARPLLSHAIERGVFTTLIDPKLDGNYIDSEMFCLIEVAAACVRHSATKRPKMTQVVRAFDSLATSDLTNGMKVGESEIFNSAQQSEEIRFYRRMAFGSQNYSTDFFSQNSSSSEGKLENNPHE